jgi:hypothetical protein
MFVGQPAPARGTPQHDRLLGHRGRRIGSGSLAIDGAQSIITRMSRLISHTPFPLVVEREHSRVSLSPTPDGSLSAMA